MAVFPYKNFDGIGLSELVKNREVTVEDLVEAAIEEIEKKNSELNAVINKMYDQARTAVKMQTKITSALQLILIYMST